MKRKSVELGTLNRGTRFALDFHGGGKLDSAEVWQVLSHCREGVLCCQILTAFAVYSECVFKASTPVYPVASLTTVTCHYRA